MKATTAKSIPARPAVRAPIAWLGLIALVSPALSPTFGQEFGPAATVKLLRATGRVIILGTGYGDQVEVSLSPSGRQVEIRVFSDRAAAGPNAEPNADPWVFEAAEVRAVEFRGGPGNDLFLNSTAIPSFAAGDEGNDVLIGGSHADVLYDDAGNDWLMGHGGDDSLSGGGGFDTLLGGSGSDWLIRGPETAVD